MNGQVLGVVVACCVWAAACGVAEAENNRFTEELLLRPLASGHIHSHFEFTTTWYSPEVSEAIQHYRDFGEQGGVGGPQTPLKVTQG